MSLFHIFKHKDVCEPWQGRGRLKVVQFYSALKWNWHLMIVNMMCMDFRDIWEPILLKQWSGSTKTDYECWQISEHLIITMLCWRLRYQYTMRCRYNAVNFLQNCHKRHTIARPLGRVMECLLWVQTLNDILTQSRQWCVQYHHSCYNESRYNATRLYVVTLFLAKIHLTC